MKRLFLILSFLLITFGATYGQNPTVVRGSNGVTNINGKSSGVVMLSFDWGLARQTNDLEYLRLDGTTAWTANQNGGGYALTNADLIKPDYIDTSAKTLYGDWTVNSNLTILGTLTVLRITNVYDTVTNLEVLGRISQSGTGVSNYFTARSIFSSGVDSTNTTVTNNLLGSVMGGKVYGLSFALRGPNDAYYNSAGNQWILYVGTPSAGQNKFIQNTPTNVIFEVRQANGTLSNWFVLKDVAGTTVYLSGRPNGGLFQEQTYTTNTWNGTSEFFGPVYITNSPPVAGHVLTCKDSSGLAEWKPQTSTSASEFTVNFDGDGNPTSVTDLPSGWTSGISGTDVTITNTTGRVPANICYFGLSSGTRTLRYPTVAVPFTYLEVSKTSVFKFRITSASSSADLSSNARIVIQF